MGSNSSEIVAARLDNTAVDSASAPLSDWRTLEAGLSAAREGPAAVALDGMATVFGGANTTEVEQVRTNRDQCCHTLRLK